MGVQQRSVDLLVDLMDAEQHFDEVTRDELRTLISEAVIVFGQLVLDRDPIPEPSTMRPEETLLRCAGTALPSPLGDLAPNLFKRHA
ncbi:MAG: hypothetical protein ACTHKQ_09315 [Mesorhizobium sp.]